MKNNTCLTLRKTLQITTLLALRALTHGITQAGCWVLLLQLTIHLHDLLVPVGSTLRDLAGLLASLLLTRLVYTLLLTRLSSLLFSTP